jgi:hypothetical protein
MTAGDSWMNRPAARISRASRQHRSSLTMNDTKQLIILATPRCVMNIARNIIFSGISLIALIALNFSHSLVDSSGWPSTSFLTRVGCV